MVHNPVEAVGGLLVALVVYHEQLDCPLPHGELLDRGGLVTSPQEESVNGFL